MEILLVAVGVFVGILSGFFGIGGGTASVPILLYMGFDIKQAIGISVFQMLMSSIFGFYLHRKNQTYNPSRKVYFGLGGIAGAIIGAYLVKVLDYKVLEYLFLGVVIFTLVKLFLSNPQPSKDEIYNPYLYTLIGSGIGIFSGMLGVGGSILMTPILVSFLGFSLKKSSAVGLFFVMFSSFSSFVSLSYFGLMDYKHGLLLGIGSLVGIWIGIWLLKKIKVTHYKTIMVWFYIFIFLITINKILG